MKAFLVLFASVAVLCGDVCFANPPCSVIASQAIAGTPAGISVTPLVVTEFAVPVAVPVAASAPYTYSYTSNAGFDATGIVNELRALRLELSQSRTGILAAKQTLVQQTCATCHSGPNPKGGVSLDRFETLSPATRLRAVQAVVAEKMPPDTKLSPGDVGKLILELSKASGDGQDK